MKPVEIHLKTWEEFEQQVEQLAHKRLERKRGTDARISEYLFRGQSNSCWDLSTTLERNIRSLLDSKEQNTASLLTLEKYYKIVYAIQPEVEAFAGIKWDIPSLSKYMEQLEKSGLFPLGKPFAFEYFIYLRHHGFPSPLLDWTQSPYVAAYFAFRDVCSKASNVSIYAYCELTAGHKTGSSSTPGITGLSHYVRGHRRHFQQQSEYTICTISRGMDMSYARHDEAFDISDEDQDELCKFNIPASERPKVLKRLEQYNINAFSLFGSDESLMETLSLREIYLRHIKNVA